MPNYVISQAAGRVILRNYEGVITTYTEPRHYENKCTCDVCAGKKTDKLEGVAALEQGEILSLEPANLSRNKRNHH